MASSSISLLMLVELDFAKAFSRSCLSSGKRIVNVAWKHLQALFRCQHPQ